MPEKLNLETLLVSGISPEVHSEPVVSPIILSTTFERGSDGNFVPGGDIYSRSSNPNRRQLEKKLALLENGLKALAFSSGQAATYAVFQALPAGSHVIIPDDIYYGTRSALKLLGTNTGITFSEINMADIEEVDSSILPETRLIWVETPSNPKLKITDIDAILKLSKKHKNILVACDNTWATPYFSKPLDLGCDLVMHSTTKYFGGHSDVLGGALMWKEEKDETFFAKIKEYQITGGAVPSPFDCWLLNRSLATFHLRMPRHAENAMGLAGYLESHPKILQVFYPGLKSNKGHKIAQKQMVNGFGGMLSVLIEGDEENCKAVAARLKVFKNATSLGGVESLVDHRRTYEGKDSTLPANLLRVSVGIENLQDLIADFKQALG
ncbi:MAG: aminotransferase class I/II-fold pyridoxal phosphate-dependent enzyme [Spirosomataceae bacterium]